MRKGRDLEILVKNIESIISKDDVAVKSPDYIYGVVSKRNREVDVSLRSKIGSVEILVIIECRKRGRIQDLTWIEQLDNKRKDVLASKAIAVSSKGFSSGAITVAKNLGIGLRESLNLTGKDIENWFKPTHLKLFHLHGDLIEAIIFLDDELAFEKPIIDELNVQIRKRPNEIFFIKLKDKKRVSILDIWKMVLNQIQIQEREKFGLEKIIKTISVNFTNPGDHLQIEIQKEFIEIKRIDFTGILHIQTRDIPISNIQSYTENGDREIAQTIQFNFKEGEFNTELSIHKLLEQDQITISIQKYSDDLE